MAIDKSKIKAIFNYLCRPTEHLKNSNGAIVFGRSDPLVAERASELYGLGLVEYLLFTGGIGKDSGTLADLALPEAKWLAALSSILYGTPIKNIYIETESRVGIQNCMFSIDTILRESLPHSDLILLVHPTSLRRIDEVMRLVSVEKEFPATYQKAVTNYKFDPSNIIDQREAVAEILRIADWPNRESKVQKVPAGKMPLEEIPLELLEYARFVERVI